MDALSFVPPASLLRYEGVLTAGGASGTGKKLPAFYCDCVSQSSVWETLACTVSIEHSFLFIASLFVLA